VLSRRALQGSRSFRKLGHSQKSKDKVSEIHITQKAKSREPPSESKLTKNKDTDIEILCNPEVLQQLMGLLKPPIGFHKADEKMTMDDVRFYWDVRAIRGDDKAFAHLKGKSPQHQMLADNMLPLASSRAEEKTIDKIVRPMASVSQSEANRMALEIVAADKGVEFAADRTNADL